MKIPKKENNNILIERLIIDQCGEVESETRKCGQVGPKKPTVSKTELLVLNKPQRSKTNKIS